MFGNTSAAVGVMTNLQNAGRTKVSGDSNEFIAEQGATDGVEREVRMNTRKEALNWMKTPSLVGVSASAEAARTAGQ